jgi:chorismate mutase
MLRHRRRPRLTRRTASIARVSRLVRVIAGAEEVAVMALRAIRGATQLDSDDRDHLLVSVEELIGEIFTQNDVDTDRLVSMIFTATPDLHSEFPALAARQLGIGDVPLLCAQEIDVEGAMPRVIRVMLHLESDAPRSEIRHVYLRGAAALRRDLAQ